MRKSWIALALVFCCAAPALAVELTLKDAADTVRLQLYGYVKADLTYDSQSTEPRSDATFTFFVLPETAEGDKDGQTRLGARESRLGLNLFGPDVGAWKTTGKIEMDFYGAGGTANSYTPRIRLAYVDAAYSSGLSSSLYSLSTNSRFTQAFPRPPGLQVSLIHFGNWFTPRTQPLNI